LSRRSFAKKDSEGGACIIAMLVPAADTPKVFARRGGQAEQAA